jgi:hypothetical protein
MKQRERVAAPRPALPQGAALQHYELLAGPADLDADDRTGAMAHPAKKMRRG